MSFSKRKFVKDVNSIVQHSRNQVKYHRAGIESQEKLIECLFQIVKNEAPEFVGKMTEIKDHFLYLLSQEKILADAEERYANDLEDISIRFEVIFRIGQELAACKKRLRSIRLKIGKLYQNLDADELKGGEKKAKIEAEIVKAKSDKVEAVRALEAKYEEFICQKEKYALFKANRLQHAFQNYGTTLAESMAAYSQEGATFQKLVSETCEEIDDLLEAGPPPEAVEETGNGLASSDDSDGHQLDATVTLHEAVQDAGQQETTQNSIQQETNQNSIQQEATQNSIQQETTQNSIIQEATQNLVQQEAIQNSVQQENDQALEGTMGSVNTDGQSLNW